MLMRKHVTNLNYFFFNYYTSNNILNYYNCTFPPHSSVSSSPFFIVYVRLFLCCNIFLIIHAFIIVG